jgi:hypothetical protein
MNYNRGAAMSIRNIMGFLCLFIFLSVPLAGFASEVQINDNLHITGSGNVLKFSDGTSQGTAGYVADGMVTTSKIVDGAVTTDKLAPKAVTADKIADGVITATQIQSGTITATQLGTNSVSSTQIAGNAVTAGKIGFYTKVAIVAPDGGDYTDPAQAMSDFASWCGSPAADNPCIVKIMPGVYNIGSSAAVMMHAYIDIEGSGENVTRIKGNIVNSLMGVVNGANNAELRFLTVEHTGGSYATAMYNSSVSPKITNVTFIASGGTSSNYGIYNDASSPKMTNVTITVTGAGSANSYGVYNYNVSSPIMMNAIVTVSGGLYARGIGNTSSSPILLQGLVTVFGASSSNTGLENYDAPSPEMDTVKIVVSGGASCFGAIITNSQLSLTNVKIDASGGATTIGVYSSGSSIVKIRNAIIKSSSSTIVVDAGGQVFVGASHLNGGAVIGSVLTCVGAYNSSWTALNTSCL